MAQQTIDFRSSAVAGDCRVTVRGVTKRYARRSANRAYTLQEAFARGFRSAFGGGGETYTALDDIDFDVHAGSMLGVIGRNGAGKSTLLRLLGRVGRPDRGTIVTKGRIGALLDLGAGLNGELTGRENVLVSGVVAGLTRAQVCGRFDEIVAFAELEDAIDAPVRTYSSGMRMRLAFSVAVHTDPQVLLVDEVLAVGDMSFQQKCFGKIHQFRGEGCAIVFVTHDTDQVRKFCDTALWLNKGKVGGFGASEQVVDAYESFMTDNTRAVTAAATNREQAGVQDVTLDGTPLALDENRFGSLDAKIGRVRLYPAQIAPGQPFRIDFECVLVNPVPAPLFGITIRRASDDLVCLSCSVDPDDLDLRVGSAEKTMSVSVSLERLDLVGGEYFVDVGAYERSWAYSYDYHYRVYPLTVTAGRQSDGVIESAAHWTLAPGL